GADGLAGSLAPAAHARARPPAGVRGRERLGDLGRGRGWARGGGRRQGRRPGAEGERPRHPDARRRPAQHLRGWRGRPDHAGGGSRRQGAHALLHPPRSPADRPVIERYSRPAMRRVWSDPRRLALWLEVELAVTAARERRGEVAAGTVARLRTRARL